MGISVKSQLNSTDVALGAGETFTGSAELSYLSDVAVTCKTDVSGTLYVEFSVDDGNNWDTSIQISVSAGVGEYHTFVKGPRSFRVRYVNGSSAQGYFRLQSSFGEFRQATSGLGSTVQQDADASTVRSIGEERFIREGRYEGRYVVDKFARNADVDAAEDIWDGGGDYTGFATSAETFTLVSTSTDDDASGTGAQSMRVYYLDDDLNAFDSSGNWLYFDIDLDGTTPVTSTVTGKRVWRASVLTAGSGKTNAGNISIYQTTTTANIFAVIATGYGQTEISNFTVPTGYTGYLIGYGGSMLDQTANQAEIAIKAISGGVQRLLRPFVVSTATNPCFKPYGGIVFSENTDFVFRATSVLNTNASIVIQWDMILVKN